MDKDLLRRLLNDDEEAMQVFGDPENCAVIDWRYGLPEVVEAVSHFLPDGYLHLTAVGPASFEININDHAATNIEVSPSANQETIIDLVNQALHPGYEIRQFRAVDGDAHSLFIAPREVWSEMEASHAKSVEKYFLSTTRLAAYWSKGYFSRLFSKP